MIDLDRTRLDRVLPASARPGDWDDVLQRAGALERRRRRELILVLAVAAIVVAGTAFASGLYDRILSSGSTSLPPEGAPASAPAVGRLVITYDGRPELRGFPGRFVPTHQVWVYTDGRVIWRRETGPVGVQGAAGEVRTGYLERRLTREGVQLLRRRILATGLFGADLYLRNAHDLVWGAIRVRNGGRLVGLYWCCYFTAVLPPAFPNVAPLATAKQARVISRLTELLATPVAHLPQDAWADREVRAFVPSRYAVCYLRWDPVAGPDTLEPSRILRFLPAEARLLLRGKDRSYPAYSSPLARDVSPSQRSVTCSELTTGDARRLAGIFRHAGYEADPFPSGSPAKPYANERFRAKFPLDVVFSFEPILPHGQWQAMGG